MECSLRAPIRGAFWVLSALALLVPEPAAAITFQTTLSPIRLYGKPGQTLTNDYQLTLEKGQPTTQFRVNIEDWWRSVDGKQSFYVPAGSLSRSCGSWVTVNPAESRVAGGEKLSVRVSVSVPPLAEPGGYWCALTIEEVADPLARPTDVGVTFLASVSTSIYVYLDPVQRSVRIDGIELTSSEVAVKLHNDGNTPVPVEGRFEFVKPGTSEIVASVPLDRQVLLMDPMPTGRYSMALPPAEVLPAARYLVRVILDIGLEHFIGAQRDLIVERSPALRGQ